MQFPYVTEKQLYRLMENYVQIETIEYLKSSYSNGIYEYLRPFAYIKWRYAAMMHAQNDG